MTSGSEMGEVTSHPRTGRCSSMWPQVPQAAWGILAWEHSLHVTRPPTEVQNEAEEGRHPLYSRNKSSLHLHISKCLCKVPGIKDSNTINKNIL